MDSFHFLLMIFVNERKTAKNNLRPESKKMKTDDMILTVLL